MAKMQYSAVSLGFMGELNALREYVQIFEEAFVGALENHFSPNAIMIPEMSYEETEAFHAELLKQWKLSKTPLKKLQIGGFNRGSAPLLP